MTDEIVENENQDLNEGVGENNQNSEFEIPEEYREKGWTKFFDGKRGDELKAEFFKSYDNSQTLIGRKVEDYIKNVDLEKLNNFENIKNLIYEKNEEKIPENTEEYALNDILRNEDGTLEFEYKKEIIDYFGDKFRELGLTKEQGQGLLKTYTDFEIDEFRRQTDTDELNKTINEMFKNNEQERKRAEGLIKEFLPKEDQAFLQKNAPNQTIEMFYKIAKGFADKYGYRESTINSSSPSNIRMSETDRDTEYNRLYNRLVELDNKPNQQVGEREEIIKAMQELFR